MITYLLITYLRLCHCRFSFLQMPVNDQQKGSTELESFAGAVLELGRQYGVDQACIPLQCALKCVFRMPHAVAILLGMKKRM